MTRNEEEKDMGATAEKKSLQPLDKNKKELLRKFMGRASNKLDLNRVRDEWKCGKNRF